MPTTVQFIAYQLKTAAEGNTARQDYPGLTDQKRDIEARCKVMLDAIMAAKGSAKISSAAKKIFAAPEFFFRGGKGGVYDIENVSYVMEFMDTYLKDDSFDKWIFVLGTALAAMPAGTDRTEVLNIAFVRRGGVSVIGTSKSNVKNALAGGSGDSRLVYKETISAVDFFGPDFANADAWFDGIGGTAANANIRGSTTRLAPTSGSRAMGDVEHLDTPNIHGTNYTWKPSKEFRDYTFKKYQAGKITWKERKRILTPITYTASEQSRTGLGGGVDFSMGGLHFALEVCLDHSQKRALSTVNADNVDIHLITSCGMSPKNFCAKDKGFLFQVDGAANHASLCWAITMNGSTVSKLTRKDTIDMTDSERWHISAGSGKNLFQAGKGRVVIFEAKALP
jgi:hypothetical protein